MTHPTNRSGTESEERAPGIPRWVKISAVIALLLLLTLLLSQLVFGVQHGPGLHSP